MLSVEGFDSLTAKLTQLAAKLNGGKPVVEVGYTAANALALHENVEMKLRGFSRDPRIRRIELGGDPAAARPRPRKREPKGKFWDPQGRAQAKFLEQPARELQQTMSQMIAEGAARGEDFGQCVLKAGLLLQRESMPLVPVDTGNTRASAFTRLTYEL